MGVAGYFDGDLFVRSNYPRKMGTRRSAYSVGWGSPAARIVMGEGIPYLFTRPGDVLRRDRNRWRRLPIRLPEPESRGAALIYAAHSPDGGLVLYRSPRTLIWTSLRGLESNRFRVERTPEDFSFLRFLGSDALYALGRNRVFYRRDGPGNWSELGRLPSREGTEAIRGLTSLADGTPAIAAERGLFLLSDEQTRLISTDNLMHRAGVPVTQGTQQANWIIRVVPMENRDDLLWIRGENQGLLGGLGYREVFWRCPGNITPVAGFNLSSHQIIVGNEGELCELTGSRCLQIHEQELNRR